MQVLNSAMHMQTVNTAEALFEQAGDEATDSSSLPDQHLWSEKGLACKTICIDVCTLNPLHSSTYNFFSTKYSAYSTSQISHIHVWGHNIIDTDVWWDVVIFFAQSVMKSSN